jgi:dipeptidyl aminopeptidase/acylaminoacyl peptidase
MGERISGKRRRLGIDHIAVIAVPQQPALSPDGDQIVYVLGTSDADKDTTLRNIWLVGALSGEAEQLTLGGADDSPEWSPDGRHVAFLRGRHGARQLWLLPTVGGEPRQLTNLPFGAGAPVWSPDGTRIAFAATVDITATETQDEPARSEPELLPVVIDRLDYQVDGGGLLRTNRTHLHVVDIATHRCRQLTDGDWNAGEPSWAPDGTLLAFAAGTAPDADLVSRVPMHVVDAEGLGEPRLVGLEDGVGGPSVWTHDGAALLVAGKMSDPGGHTGLLRVPLDGGEIINLAARLDRNVMPGAPAYPGALPQLSADGSTAYFCIRDRGCTHVYSVPASGGRPSPVIDGVGRNVTGLSIAGDTAAVVLTTPTSFGEILLLDLPEQTEKVRTRHGSGIADAEIFIREQREFSISDGIVVEGWLVRDPTASTPAPLLVDIHGGPHNAWNGTADDVHLYHQELAAKGWAVLTVNPRGSDGYGEEFFTAGRGAWGLADANDFIEPIDALVADGLVDPTRIAVAGYSYGGFMACYLTSRYDRFAAAAAGGPVTDLVSMTGTSDDGRFVAMYECGGTPADLPEQYAASSPITGVGQVRTPTLVLQGLSDIRCPTGQAQQWFASLRASGVPTRLVLYPEASHLFILDGRPSHRTDYQRRIVDWVERYANGG